MLELLLATIRDLSRVAEFVGSAQRVCAAREEYDRKSTPLNLRKLTLAQNEMYQLHKQGA